MKFIPLFAIAVLALAVAGCDRPQAAAPAAASKGTVAFLDIVAAAKRLGRDVAINEEITAQKKKLAEQLDKEKTDYQAKYNEQRQSVGDKPTQVDAQKLTELEQQLNTALQSHLQQANNDLEMKNLGLVQKFREEIKPIAKRIAAEKGFNTVMLINDAIISYDPATDITEDVIGEMASKSGTKAAPAAPAATP